MWLWNWNNKPLLLALPGFFAENRQKLLNGLFKIYISLKILNNKILLDILLFGLDYYKYTVNKEIIVHTTDFLKTTKSFEKPLFDRWYYFVTTFLIYLLHSQLLWKYDVVTLLARYQLLQISIFFSILKQCLQVLLGSKHIFVQHLAVSVLSEVSVGWRTVIVLILAILFWFYL